MSKFQSCLFMKYFSNVDKTEYKVFKASKTDDLSHYFHRGIAVLQSHLFRVHLHFHATLGLVEKTFRRYSKVNKLHFYVFYFQCLTKPDKDLHTLRYHSFTEIKDCHLLK